MRVEIDPGAVAALGLSLEEIRAALSQATVSAPKGIIDGPRRSVTLATSDQLSDADDFGAVVIGYHNGAAVRVRDVGRAIDGVEDVRQAAWLGNKRVVIIDVHKQPGFNINDTVQRVKDALPELGRALPPSVRMQVLGDRTQVIRGSVAGVQHTMAISIGLVVVVVFLFLRHAAATLIPSAAIPVSLLCACAAMYLFGYTIDNVSLMALTIAVGFIIDDAIVMVENIIRHAEAGQPPLAAALVGSREIVFTILSMTLSLVAVFIPLLLMSGLIGRLFREFAVTISIALLMSAFVSLTVTPMMCGWLLRPAARIGENHLAVMLDTAFRRSLRFYESGLRWALRHPPVMIAIMAAAVAATICLYLAVPKGFFPPQDNGLIVCTTEAASDISYAEMVNRQRALARLIMADPDVATVYYWVGGQSGLNSGRIMVDLKPLAERSASATEVFARLRKAATRVPGIVLFGQARQDVQIGAKVSKTQYQYTVQDPDVSELFHWAPILLKRLAGLPQLQDVTGDLQAAAPRLMLQLDRDTLGRLGISPQAVDDILYDAFGQRQVATIFTQSDQRRVVLEIDPRAQSDPDVLSRLYVRSGTSGKLVPLAALTVSQNSITPLTINHQDGFPLVTLSFNLAPGISLGEAVAAIGRAERLLGLPSAMTTQFEGTAKVFTRSLATQPYLIAAAILAVYIVLGILYENFVHPLTILSTLPSAGAGAFAALLLLHYEFTLIALIGVILLVGIVKKNAIMMVDFALDAERHRHLAPAAAIYEAARLQFRPIMMTTMAALLGALPLALGSGPGSELRRPLGITLVGGLLVSQLLTLYTTPVVYLYMSRLSGLKRRRRTPATAAIPEKSAAE